MAWSDRIALTSDTTLKLALIAASTQLRTRPLRQIVHAIAHALGRLALKALAGLTKINWNSTQVNQKLPIRAARTVAKYVSDESDDRFVRSQAGAKRFSSSAPVFHLVPVAAPAAKALSRWRTGSTSDANSRMLVSASSCGRPPHANSQIRWSRPVSRLSSAIFCRQSSGEPTI